MLGRVDDTCCTVGAKGAGDEVLQNSKAELSDTIP